MTYGKKTGGRKKGSRNKPKPSQEMVERVLGPTVADYFDKGTFQKDLAELTAKERITVMERYTNYVLPKRQSTDMDLRQEEKPSEDFIALLATLAENGGSAEAARITDND